MCRNLKKTSVLSVVLVLIVVALPAQNHNSISVDEVDLYRLLEIAEISGMIDRLPSARPLPLSAVKRALGQMENSRIDLSAWQKEVLDEYLDRFVRDEDKSILKDGDIRYDHDILPVTWRFSTENDFKIDVADTRQGGIHNIFNSTLSGGLGESVSYGFKINIQLNKVNIDDNAPYPYAWEPYTYTKVGDGGARYLSAPSLQYLMPRSLALGWALYPEIAFSFWDNRVDLRLARLRRDWGLGEGNLFLDEQARPFLGFEGILSPWKWLTFTFLFGGLEYGPSFRKSPFGFGEYPLLKDGVSDYTIGISEVSRVQQNMLSIFQLELAPTKWLYISLFDAVIYLKRLELGYMFPFMSKLLHQNNTGDFDNVMFGASLALSWPGLFRAYGTFYIDEWNPTIPLNSLRNQLAYQAGVKATIPMDIWSLLTFQYTKIEPFTYTHYVVKGAPWYYSLEMETGYLNNGENLGSYLEPNSDEFILSFHVQPAPWWTAGATYRLIRHGTGAGSTYDSWGYQGGPDGDPNGAYANGTSQKNFLKDGTYEWFHVLSLGGSIDLRNFIAPARISLQYSFVYEYDTNSPANNSFNPVGGSRQFRHLIGLNLKIFPK